jgi:transcriptional regulator with XRE-family HTH domain
MTKRGGWPPTGFGERLRAIRSAAGLSQKALAERAGCNLFTVAKLERGAQEPAWPLVLALAQALGVSCQDFAGVGADQASSGRSPRSEGRANRGRGRPRKPLGPESALPPDSGGRPGKRRQPNDARRPKGRVAPRQGVD